MQAPQCKHMHEMLVKEHHRFTPVFVKDVERHCERCAHLPHKNLKDVNLYFEITKVCLFENRLLRLSGFCVGGAHIFQDVFQHLSQKQEQNRYLKSVCFLLPNTDKAQEIMQVPFFRSGDTDDFCFGFVNNSHKPFASTRLVHVP